MAAALLKGQDGVRAVRLRALAAVAAFATGLVCARELPLGSGAWFSAALAALSLAGAGRGRMTAACMAAATACLGAGVFASRINERPRGGVLTAIEAGGPDAAATIEGLVVDGPRAVTAAGALAGGVPMTPRDVMVVDAAVIEFGGVRSAASGGVTCWAESGSAGVRAGDRVRVRGELSTLRGPMNPGVPDGRRLAAQRGIVATMTADRGGVERIEDGAGPGVRARWIRLRESLHERARAVLASAAPDSGPERALVMNLLLGEREQDLGEVEGAFTRLGLAHVLAISGFHIGVLAWVALGLLRLTGDRGWVEPVLVAALVGAYLAIAPAEAPIVRSGVMTLALLAAEAVGRRYDRLTILLWTSLLLLVWHPMDLWSLGWQLSCGMTAVLLWLGERAHAAVWGAGLIVPGRPREPTVGRWLRGGLTGMVSAALLCWLASLPLIWWSVGTASPLSVVATVLISPIVVPLMGLGFAAMLLGSVVPPVAPIAGWLVGVLAKATVGVVAWLDALPLATVPLPPIHFWAAAVATGAVLWWCARGRRARPVVRRGVIAAAALVLVVSAGLRMRLAGDVVIRVDTLAVGDGTCHMLRAGGWGCDAVLWDCGSLRSGIGVRELPAAMRALGVWHVRRAVISHGDFDHYSALPDVARRVGLRAVFVDERFLERARLHPQGPAAECLRRLSAMGVRVGTVTAGDELAIGDCRLRFLSPPPACDWPQENDHSLVATLTPPGGAPAVLLTGDIEARAVSHLTDTFPDLAAEVMEAPHHGSNKPEAAAWAARVRPSVVLQSTGPKRIDPSAWDAMRRETRCAWLSTAEHGAAWAELGPAGVLRFGTFR